MSVLFLDIREAKYTTLKPTQAILSVAEMLTTAEEVQLSAVTQISRGCPQRGTDWAFIIVRHTHCICCCSSDAQQSGL